MTSTLQQEGGRKLRLSSSQVMRVAQGLYERGLHHLHAYRQRRALRRGDAGDSCGGHEPVRPAVPVAASPKQYSSKVEERAGGARGDPPDHPVPHAPRRSAASSTARSWRSTGMIWQRTLASQMADATGITVSVRLGADAVDRPPASRPTASSRPSGTTITFPGYRAVYVEATDDDGARRRRRGAAAAARRRATWCRRVADAEGPHHLAAGPLHRGLARQAPRGARHRPAVDLGVDHPDHPGPRLRVEEGPGARADLDRVRRRRPAGAALRRPRRLRASRPRSRKTSTRSPAASQQKDQWLKRFYFGDDADLPGLKRLVEENLDEIDAAEINTFPLGTRPRRRRDRRQARQVRAVREARRRHRRACPTT